MKSIAANTMVGIVMAILASCSARPQEREIMAQTATQQAKSSWEQSARPIAVKTSTAIAGLEELCVSAELTDAFPEERNAFRGAVFVRKGAAYSCSDPHALVSDTTQALSVCYPVRSGLSKDAVIRIAAPFGENLVGTETCRHHADEDYAFVSEIEMNSAMAVLELVFESVDLSDMLDRLRVYSDGLATAGDYKPFTGQWSNLCEGGWIEAQDAGCVLANGRDHDIFLVPTSEPSSVQVFATVNGIELSAKTTLPPMAPGSLVRLNLRKEGTSLKISGSWVATKRPLVIRHVAKTGDAKTGQWLRIDGTVVPQPDSLCVAVVIETDGMHGKAVAIRDCEEPCLFGGLSSGVFLPTIDGVKKEGIINPTRIKEIGEDKAVAYVPGTAFSPECALGYTSGAELTSSMMAKVEKPDERTMLEQARRHPASYVPTLAEMVSLYVALNPVKGEPAEYAGSMQPLTGMYLTSSESTESAYWSIDFDNGAVTGSSSKHFTPAKLRLFYVF